jgi:hypothetical protein
MSLCCDETKRNIEFGDRLFAGTRHDVPFFSALSGTIIDKIPDSERQAQPTKTGVDIHEADSGRNLNDAYTLCGFSLGKFLFSISKKSAIKYLPNLSNKIFTKSF